MIQKLFVTIKSKQKLLYKGDASNVTSTNSRGEFAILAYHTNFITLVSSYISVDKGLNTEQTFKIDKALLVVLNNTVDVYVGL